MKAIMKVLIILLSLVLNHASEANERIEFKLINAEQRALEASLDLKESNLLIQSVLYSEKSVQRSQLPQVNLEGSFTYLETVPEVQLGTFSRRLGDNQNYSIGPTLSWNIWDSGVKSNLKKSLKLLFESHQTQAEALKTNLLVNLRLEYLKAIVYKEEIGLVEQRIKILRIQNNDLKLKRNAGASSSLDISESNREMHKYELELESKKEMLKGVMISLLHLTGELNKADFLTLNDFSSLLELDSLDKLVPRMKELAKGSFDELNYAVLSHKMKSESLSQEAESIKSRNLPNLSLRMRLSYDYPNGPQLESFNQNTVGLTLSMPIFDWGKTSSEAQSKFALSEVENARARKVYLDKLKAWETLKSELASLDKRIIISEQLVKESERVTKMKSDSYRSGKITFTDLEAAHLRELESKFELLRIKSMIFSNSTLIASLISRDSK